MLLHADPDGRRSLSEVDEQMPNGQPQTTGTAACYLLEPSFGTFLSGEERTCDSEEKEWIANDNLHRK